MSKRKDQEPRDGFRDTLDRLQKKSETERKRQEINTASKQEKVRELRARNDHQEEDLKGKKQDRKQRKSFSYLIFIFLCVYLELVFVILFFSGFSGLAFRMADSVLITLLSTTTVNVIGIFILVVKYLFPTERSVP